jgi:hypothetical protein
MSSYNALFGLGSHSVDSALEGWWKLQDNTASVAVLDSGSLSRDGATGGTNTSAMSVSGPKGYISSSLSFNNSASRMVRGTANTAITSAGNSIGCWVKLSSTSRFDPFLWFGQTTRNDRRYQLSCSSGGVWQYTAQYDSNSATASGGVKDDNWHFVTGVSYGQNNHQIFLDGVSLNTSTNFSNADNRSNFSIGGSNGSTKSYAIADIAEAFCFRRSLSTNEIVEIYAGPEPLNTVAPTLSISVSSWGGTVGTWDSQGNGSITYEWELRDADDDSVVESGTGSSPKGFNTYSGDYYLWVRASNDGGYDSAEDSVSADTTATKSPRIVQTLAYQLAGTSTRNVSLPESVQANNTIVVVVLKVSGNTRSASVSDSINGSYTSVAKSIGSQSYAEIFVLENSSGGIPTITVSQSGTYASYGFEIYEFDAAKFDVGSSFNSASFTTTHPCTAAGGITTKNNTYVLAATATNSTILAGQYTVATNYTELRKTDQSLIQFRQSNTSLASEEPVWTTSATRATHSATASLIARVPLNTVDPALSGTETEGQTLTSTTGTWDSQSNGTVTYGYQWTRSDDGAGTGEADISGATSSTYTLVTADVGKFIRCRVRGTNNGGFDSVEDTNSNMSGAIAASGGGPTFKPYFALRRTQMIGMA